ncbi:MAG: tetratricopeptide repeat protein [Acidobacteriota bacterium]|nr:tetratricopeptide repeat protein [Acidobacteriota bacterium]
MRAFAFLMPIALAAFPLAAQEAEHQTGLRQYGAKDYRAAAESFRKAMQTEKAGSPAYGESALLLGESLYLLGRFEGAIPALKAAPHTNEGVYMLANSYLKTHDIPNCVQAFAEMFGVPAASAAAHLIAGQMMMRQEFNEEAEAQLLQAVALDPKLPQAHYLLGELNLFKGLLVQAAAQLKTEISINPDSAMAYYKLGDVYGRQSQWDAAIPTLQKSIWLNSTNSGPYILLGKAYLRQKQFSNAEGMLRRAAQLDPRNSSAHYLLGQTLIQEGHLEEGKAMLALSQKLKN